MKNFFLASLTLLSATGFSQINSFNEKANLKINTLLVEKKLAKGLDSQPLFVIDGKPALQADLQNYLNLAPENIINVSILNKELGTAIWGKEADKGVLLIGTNLGKTSASKTYEDSDILYVYDNKIISKEEMSKLNASKDIASIDVFREKGKYKLFNNEEYDAIMVFKSKVD